MEDSDRLTKKFRNLYERFLLGCDAIEEMGAWDKESFGGMGVFYETDLIGLILRLIVADGTISTKEVAYLNRNFGLDYTVTKLAEVYESCRETINGSFDEQFKNGITRMKEINGKLANAYAELVGIICDIVIAGDGDISPEERGEIQRIKALF